jgi:small subunit ribosomal protein S17
MAKTTTKSSETKSSSSAASKPATKGAAAPKASSRKPQVAASGRRVRTAESLGGLAGSPTSAQARLAQRATVKADSRDKTRTVIVEFAQAHAKYGKIVRKRTSIQIHDEANESHTGDLVEISPCRPVSKSKRWRLVRIVERRSVINATIEAPSA